MFNIKLILILLNIPEIGRKTANGLIKGKLPKNLESYSIFDFLNENMYKFKKINSINMKSIYDAKVKCENILKKCEKEDIKIISILDDDFPEKLKNIKDNPLLIYYKGNIDCIKNNQSICLIGRRKISQKGKEITGKIGQLLVENNFIIISGLALGCDTYAHMSAIKNKGKTVAVMPCGLDIIYPLTNKDLFCDILKNKGCIVSEYAPGTKPYKHQFIERDRLESALSQALIVIETTMTGGSMHTVNFALNQHKLIACCKNEINNHLIENKNIYSIYNKKSLYDFLNIVKSKIDKNYIEKEFRQLIFII